MEKSSNYERTPNFTSGEKDFLVTLIAEKYSKILEDKKTDRTSILDKKKCWKNIADEFNATGPIICYRNADSLKRLYENQKKNLRKRIAEERRERFATGGGVAKILKNQETDEVLLSILNKKSVEGFYNAFDCDANENITENTAIASVSGVSDIFDNDADQVLLLEQNVESNNMENEENDEPNVAGTSTETFEPNWKKPNDIRSPMNPILRSRSRASTGTLTNNNSLPKTNRRRVSRAKVCALSSSIIAEKYDQLLDKRSLLIDKQINDLEKTASYLQRKEKLELEILENTNEKTKLEVQLLKLQFLERRNANNL